MPLFDDDPRPNGAVLKWARDFAGLTLEGTAVELSKKLPRKTPHTSQAVSAWEAERRVPTLSELSALADIYRRPMAMFFMPEPPEELFPSDYRLPSEGGKALTRGTRLAIREAMWLQAVARDLYEALHREPPKIARASLSDEPEVVANRERERLKLESSESAKDPESALRARRECLEAAGILTFRVALPIDQIQGLALHDSLAPAVVTSSEHGPQAQSFTLFHEYTHLLLRTEPCMDAPFAKLRTTARGAVAEVERYCNAVAGAMLFPRDAAYRMPGTSDEHIERAAKDYRISRWVVAICLARYGRISRAFCNAYLERTALEGKRRGGGKSDDTWPSRRVNERGSMFVRLVFDAWNAGSATVADACNYLGVPSRKLADIEEVLHNRSASEGRG